MNGHTEPPASIELDLDEALLLVVALEDALQDLRAPPEAGASAGQRSDRSDGECRDATEALGA
jgi:hypothetical protein